MVMALPFLTALVAAALALRGKPAARVASSAAGRLVNGCPRQIER